MAFCSSIGNLSHDGSFESFSSFAIGSSLRYELFRHTGLISLATYSKYSLCWPRASNRISCQFPKHKYRRNTAEGNWGIGESFSMIFPDSYER